MAHGDRDRLIALLQLAHSGELAAAHAYTGHAGSLRRRHPDQAAEVDAIKAQEIDHRGRVRAMLDTLGVEPETRRERKLDRIGRVISAFCYVGGWFGPMYGAARLERKNIGEYERAAGYALGCGREELVEDLIEMSEVEWDHERYFREHCEGHWLWRLFPHWNPPPPRDEIRAGVERLVVGSSGGAR